MATDPPLEAARRVWRFGDAVEPLRRHVRQGGVLIIPSESSYGLAVDPRSAEGVEAIYRLKGRERGKPLPVVAANRQQILDLGVAPEAPGFEQALHHWPAPLSLVWDIARPLPATAGIATLAVRIPAHEPLRRLLVDLGCPLTATSANLAGQPPILDPDRLIGWTENANCILLDGGVLPGGRPSTLLKPRLGKVEVLRQGAFDTARWTAAESADGAAGGDPEADGQQ